MNRLGRRRSFLATAGLLLVSIFLLAPGTEAQTGYQEGQQHLFPYYVPDAEESQSYLANVYYAPLSGENASEQVFNFARRHLRLNPLGAVVFGSALYQASGIDPTLQDQNRCGIAGWACDGERWQKLLSFGQLYSFDHRDLKTQLLFVNLELNGLGQTVGSYGDYQNTYDSIKVADDFAPAAGLFMEDYLDNPGVDLTGIAQDLYGYDDSPQPEPPVEPPEVPEPEPEPEPVVPPEEPTRPAPTGCRAGLSSGFIATEHAGDQSGPYLESVAIRKLYDNRGSTTTLVHRCLQAQVSDLLRAYNARSISEDNRLGGWGWRSNQRQIELRRKNCGSTHYDIYDKPANDCSTPTARPGLSAHQDGLAVDFYCKDAVVTKTNCGGAFRWLDCHAAEYGLINLESEPWHWFHPLIRPERVQEKLAAGC